ncbi:uncharacterized protein LOC118404294 [Branchiostoma floridae]|uniref:Uncharacterized protein LOC118404294 n=1 Tax=Branchiostoma floridae TaxID=7739 RepID=A0A9J7KEM8_BRAFL|nr:uncharacterized protein LOC118404294 [Branchiostoma floridae]
MTQVTNQCHSGSSSGNGQTQCSSCDRHCGADVEPTLMQSWEDLSFLCRRCTHTRNGKGAYDFEAALYRMQEAHEISREDVAETARRERLLLENYKVALPDRIEFDHESLPGTPDEVSIHILDAMEPIVLMDHCPVFVRGDGNCLYRAVSRALYGDEKKHLHIRLLTCLEMIKFPEFYDANSPNYKNLIGSDVFGKPIYFRLLADALTPQEWGETIHVYAISSALHLPIETFCPHINRPHMVSAPLCRKVCGRDVDTTQDAAFTLMWTMTYEPPDYRDGFKPNHFCVLHMTEPSLANFIDLTDADHSTFAKVSRSSVHTDSEDSRLSDSEWQKLTSGRGTVRSSRKTHHTGARKSPGWSPVQTDSEGSRLSDIEWPKLTSGRGTVASCSKPRHDSRERYSRSPGPSASSSSEASPVSSPSRSREPSPSMHHLTTDALDTVDPPAVSPTDVASACIDATENGNARREVDFLPLEEVVRKLLDRDIEPRESVPRGIKQNVSYIVDNSQNIAKRSGNNRSEFHDDCGSWSSKANSTPKTLYIREDSGRLRTVYRKNGQICTKRHENKKATFVPLVPQPQPESVLEIFRNYAKLRKSDSYERKITWIGNSDRQIACVEYKGKYPGVASHGNSKSNSRGYIRTKGSVMEKIREGVKTAPPKSVYKNLVLENPIHDSPRNSQQVQNIKYLEKKKDQQIAGPRGNFADHLQHIVNTINDHPFVQSVIYAKQHEPVIILYIKNQINDIKRFCCSGNLAHAAVLCVDKTFNLSDVHVTATVFKNLSIISRKTDEHPLFIGPMFLHGNSDFLTYSAFFSHLASQLEFAKAPCSPIIGSDDENAMRKAIRVAFPRGKNITCSRHLRNNVKDRLQNKIGLDKQDRQKIVKAMFGAPVDKVKGIASATDIVEFERRVQDARALISTKAASFSDHFENNILPVMKNNFEVQNHPTFPVSEIPWTNNNCESINHQLKLATEWKPRPLIDIMEILFKEVQLQYEEVKRAFVDIGDYELAPEYKKKFRKSLERVGGHVIRESNPTHEPVP